MISPAVLGSGVSFWSGIDMPALGYEVREHVTTKAALHVLFEKTPAPK